MNFINRLIHNSSTWAQIIKFSLVGFVNTGVDWLVFTLLSVVIFGGTLTTLMFVVAKALGFLVATLNSYFLNSRVVFFARDSTGKDKDSVVKVAQFMSISTLTFVLNIAVGTSAFALLRSLSPELSQNITGQIAFFVSVFAVTVINFVGYKFIVFKK